MDQEYVVNQQSVYGKRLIDALAASGFEVSVAFWAKETEVQKWRLYLASPFWDEKGPLAAIRHLSDVMKTTPDHWIDPMEVRLLGMRDSLAQAALGARRPKPYPGLTYFGESYLSDLEVDGVYIYPQMQTAVSA